MPVNYLKLNQQIREMGKDALSREADLARAMEQLTYMLNERANDLKALQQQVEEAAAKTKGLRCAVPVSEPLNSHFSCPLPAPACTIFAADGSQINPDAHDEVLFGLINIGIFRILPGSGDRCMVCS